MPKATKSSEAPNEPGAAESAADTSPAPPGNPTGGKAAKSAKSAKSTKPTKTGASTSKVTKQAAPTTATAPEIVGDGTTPDQPDAAQDAAEEERESESAQFLAEQRALLIEERASYTRQADELKAEADSLALEHEPGDVQFDEEGGEGGTSNVDRELDLVLSAQARGAVAEIDRALIKVEIGTYGVCEQCGQPIPHARLQALPYAALCVACKSGGLSRR